MLPANVVEQARRLPNVRQPKRLPYNSAYSNKMDYPAVPMRVRLRILPLMIDLPSAASTAGVNVKLVSAQLSQSMEAAD